MAAPHPGLGCLVIALAVELGCATPKARPEGATREPSMVLPPSPLDARQKAAHLLDRASFGPRPSEVTQLASGGDRALETWLEEQLQPATLADPEVSLKLGALPTLTASIPELEAEYPPPAGEGSERNPDRLPRRIGEELVTQKLVRAAESRRQLEELLVDFWFNHFNVSATKGPTRWMVTAYERDAIRPHVFGRFRELLGATAQHPAMLFYLDNWLSTREPPSGRAPAKPGAPSGLNENYARELLELHTLGVNGGYDQGDVREVARCFTGWTIDKPQKAAQFVFRPRAHDPDPKLVLGVHIDRGGQGDGEQVLDLLARHPSTARFISRELAQRFVADDPPPALVERLARVFLDTDGDLLQVYRALFTSPEFWSAEAYRAKIKQPLEFAVSAVRVLDGHLDYSPQFAAAIARMGEPLYECQPPTGYSDASQAWVNTGELVARLNFGLRLATGRINGAHVHFLQLGGGLYASDPAPLVQRVGAALLSGEMSAPTESAIDEELRQEVRTMPDGEIRPIDLPKLVALVVGSPEFQRR
jgi:hypothetical protein